MKHTEIPNEFNKWTVNKELQHGDKLVYAMIRRHMDANTRTSKPSVSYLCRKLNCSRSKVDGAIERLEKLSILEHTQAPGGVRIYHFPETEFDKSFERFTDDFLDMDLPLNVKEYYMDLQNFLYIDKENRVGTTLYSNNKIGQLTG